VISIAPLLGILGTVLGIMKSFHALDFQHLSAPGEVGHGLAEAMITTAVGLSIAVPTLVLFNFFNSLASRYAGRIYSAAESLRNADLHAAHREDV
jgi:biopolymer transport protein ExbB